MSYAGADEMGYYAFPAMTLDGTMGIGAKEQPIVGRAWMEHQWGDFPVGEYQWKYLAVQIQREQGGPHEQLLLFKARKGRKGWIYHGVWVDPDGQQHTLDDRLLEIKDGEQFNGYPVVTKVTYQPSGGDVLAKGLALHIHPVLRDQECRIELPRAFFPEFWEGVCRVENGPSEMSHIDGQPIYWGYAIKEMAGYR